MGYIKQSKTETVTHDVIVKCFCDNCEMELEPVMARDGVWQSCSAVNSLKISLSGSFGEFFDGPDVHAVFCKSCAVRMATEFPKLFEMIKDWGEY